MPSGGGEGNGEKGAPGWARVAALVVAAAAIILWVASQLGAGGPLEACRQQLAQVTSDKTTTPELVEVCGPHDVSLLVALLGLAALLVWKDIAEISFLGSGVKKSGHALGERTAAELERESTKRQAEAAQVSEAAKASLETLEQLLEDVLSPQMDEGQRQRTVPPPQRTPEQGIYAEWYSTHRDALLEARSVLQRGQGDLASMTPRGDRCRCRGGRAGARGSQRATPARPQTSRGLTPIAQ